jgi:hypothetical protein
MVVASRGGCLKVLRDLRVFSVELNWRRILECVGVSWCLNEMRSVSLKKSREQNKRTSLGTVLLFS